MIDVRGRTVMMGDGRGMGERDEKNFSKIRFSGKFRVPKEAEWDFAARGH